MQCRLSSHGYKERHRFLPQEGPYNTKLARPVACVARHNVIGFQYINLTNEKLNGIRLCLLGTFIARPLELCGWIRPEIFTVQDLTTLNVNEKLG